MLKDTHKQSFLRLAIAIIYIWFGALKVFDVSPAAGVVIQLSQEIIPFIEPELFVVLLGVSEVGLGLAFLFLSFTYYAKRIMYLHMLTTILPLIMLPSVSWSGLGILTLEGQYIVKNLALIGAVMMIEENSVLDKE